VIAVTARTEGGTLQGLRDFLTGYDAACGRSSSWPAMVMASQLGPSTCTEPTTMRSVSKYEAARKAYFALPAEDREIIARAFHEVPGRIPPCLRADGFRVSLEGGVKADLVLVMAWVSKHSLDELARMERGNKKALGQIVVTASAALSSSLGRYLAGGSL
jgi:hypothetical protein